EQLGRQGLLPGDVQVQRAGDESTVEVGAEDGAGRQLKVVRKTRGGEGEHLQLDVAALDDAREPGMTDEQLRDKILRQLRARGLEAEVVVSGDRVEVRAR